MHSTEHVNNDSFNKNDIKVVRNDIKDSNLQELNLNQQNYASDSSTTKVSKRPKSDEDKPAKSLKLNQDAEVSNEIKRKETNEKVSIESSHDINNNENIKNDLINQQGTIIFENGQSCLQFHLNPEINSNSQITLKVLPITTNDTSLLLNHQQQQQNKIQHQSNNKGLFMNGTSNAFNLSSPLSSTKYEQQQIPCFASLLTSSNIISSNNKKSDENINNKALMNSNSSSGTTTIINLNESDSIINNNNGNIYFMMQTSTDLLQQNIQTTTSSSLMEHQMKSHIKSLNNNETKTLQQTLVMNKNLDINELTTNVVLNNNGLMTYNNNDSPMSSSSSTTSSCSINDSPNQTSSSTKIVRDERRRANHNEVERRRRDNINKWIVELSKVIPDCSNNQSKHGQSKGGILEKTVQYLSDIKQTNQHLANHIQSLHQIREENDILKQQNEIYKKENEYFKSKYGIKETSPSSASSINNSCNQNA